MWEVGQVGCPFFQPAYVCLGITPLSKVGPFTLENENAHSPNIKGHVPVLRR